VDGNRGNGRVRIAEWQWDEENREHIARHGVRERDVFAVEAGRPRFRRNRNQRAATHVMIGPDRGGRFLAVFIVADVGTPDIWRRDRTACVGG